MSRAPRYAQLPGPLPEQLQPLGREHGLGHDCHSGDVPPGRERLPPTPARPDRRRRRLTSWSRPIASSHRTATLVRVGTPSFKSWSNLPLISGCSRKKPVRLPPGRAMLVIHPLATGSASSSATMIGTVLLASRAARVASTGSTSRSRPPGSAASSRARAGNRLSFPMRIPGLDVDILSLRIAGFLQPGHKRAHGGVVGGVRGRTRAEQADTRNPNGGLGLSGERRGKEGQEHEEPRRDHGPPSSARPPTVASVASSVR